MSIVDCSPFFNYIVLNIGKTSVKLFVCERDNQMMSLVRSRVSDILTECNLSLKALSQREYDRFLLLTSFT